MLKTVLKNFFRLMLVALILGFAFYFWRGSPPFTAIASRSMEPIFTQGDIILTEAVLPTEIQEGDIIIFTVPDPIREKYGYPPSIAHRVIKVDTSGRGLSFRTKGDRTGEDPFTVLPKDIKGKYRDRIPYLGHLVLFFYSKQGFIFGISTGLIFLLYSFSNEFSQGGQKLRRGLLTPVIEENRHASQLITQKMETTEQVLEKFTSAIEGNQQTSQIITQRMEAAEQVLDKFTSAIEVYAQHLQSHTSAIQGLSGAAQELKKSAAEQNKVIFQLKEFIQQTMPRTEQPAHKVEEAIPMPEEIIPSSKALILRPEQLKVGTEQD